MTQVEIEATDTDVHVTAPYDEAFREGARDLGGRWNGSARVWRSAPRDLERVRALCRTVYGTAGAQDEADMVTVRLDLGVVEERLGHRENGSVWVNAIRLAGRQVCVRLDRDGRVRLGDGVVLIEGAFQSSGGSMRNPALGDMSGIVVEVRDVPALAVKPLRGERGVEVVDTRVDVVALRTRRAELIAELEALDARLAEVDI